MKNILNKLSAILVMLTCMSAMAQAEIVHHTVCEPSLNHRGFTRECWENTETGKLYFDAACTQELTGVDLAKAVVYAKHPKCPITSITGSKYFAKLYEHNGLCGYNFNWAAGELLSGEFGPFTVGFEIEEENAANVRLVWGTEHNSGATYGKCTISIFVNNTRVYHVKEDWGSSLYVENLQNVTSGDIVSFMVERDTRTVDYQFGADMAVSLEYTFDCHHEYPEGSYTCSKCGYTFDLNTEHHTVCEPTLNHRGFTRECWENLDNGRFYSDAVCTQELTGVDLAKAVVYAKLPVNPVSSTNEFDVVEFDNTETWGINMNWAVETTFSNAYSGWSSTPRSAEFRLSGKEVGDVRLVWMKNQGNQVNGRFAVKIFVKDVLTQTSTEVYSFTQNGDYEGVSVQNLQGLKKGDIVKFEVAQICEANWHEGAPTFKACLEYTIPIATEVSANEDPDNKGVFYATFYDSAKSYVIPEGATAYTGTICDDMLLLAPVKTGVIPKGEAVIIRSDSDMILLIPSNSEEAKNPDNVLCGTDIDATCPGDSYILTYAQNGIGFYSHAAGKTIAAHKAYLLMPSEVQTKALRMVFADDEIVR